MSHHRHLLLTALQKLLEREAAGFSQWHEPEDLVGRARALVIEPAFMARRILVLKGPNCDDSEVQKKVRKEVQTKAFRLLGMLRQNHATLPDSGQLADLAKLLIQVARNDAKADERLQKTYPVTELTEAMSDSRVDANGELRKTPDSERMARVMAALRKLKLGAQHVLVAFWLDRKLLTEDSADKHCPDLAHAPEVVAIRQARQAALALDRENPANTANKAYCRAFEALRRAMKIAALFLLLIDNATPLQEEKRPTTPPQLVSKQCRTAEPEALLAVSKQCRAVQADLGLRIASQQCRTSDLETPTLIAVSKQCRALETEQFA